VDSERDRATQEEKEEGSFKANAVNEEGSEEEEGDLSTSNE